MKIPTHESVGEPTPRPDQTTRDEQGEHLAATRRANTQFEPHRWAALGGAAIAGGAASWYANGRPLEPTEALKAAVPGAAMAVAAVDLMSAALDRQNPAQESAIREEQYQSPVRGQILQKIAQRARISVPDQSTHEWAQFAARADTQLQNQQGLELRGHDMLKDALGIPTTRSITDGDRRSDQYKRQARMVINLWKESPEYQALRDKR